MVPSGGRILYTQAAVPISHRQDLLTVSVQCAAGESRRGWMV